jgi:hypothetical protein
MLHAPSFYPTVHRPPPPELRSIYDDEDEDEDDSPDRAPAPPRDIFG